MPVHYLQYPMVIDSGNSFANKTTTLNTYVDVGVWECGALKTKHLAFSCVDNDLKAQVLGSFDGGLTYPLVLQAEFTVTKDAAAVSKTLTTFATNAKVQVKPASADAHGTLTTVYGGASY